MKHFNKKPFIIFFIVLLASLISLMVYLTTTNTKPVNSYNINDIKQVIVNYIHENGDKRDGSYVLVSEDIEIFEDSWLTVPVTYLNEPPDSYNRNYVFILQLYEESLQVLSFKQPGWFTTEDLPKDSPDTLKDVVLGEPHA